MIRATRLAGLFGGAEGLRWSACFALALAFHAGGAAALLARWNETTESIATAPVILIDFAPVAAAPQTEQLSVAPGPQRVESQPEPEPPKEVAVLEQKPDPSPDPVLAVTPPPRPPEPEKPKIKRQHQAKLTSAPTPAERRAARAVAPAPGAIAHDSLAVPTWKSRIAAALERHKRYPSEARSHGDQGVAQLAFSIDRQGGVHHARIVRSSGSSSLDRATLDLIQRAQPLPPPPPEISGAQIAITVPIRYNIR
jgi:protein TonB